MLRLSLSFFFLAGKLYRLRNEVNHPFGLTLLHEHLYWTDWNTNSVYRAEINSGANITCLATKLKKPMDIHAYNVKPKQGESNKRDTSLNPEREPSDNNLEEDSYR